MGPGSLIGNRFAVSKLLEEDALSQVFRAQDQTTGLWVAAKVVRDAKRGQVRDRFFRECELLAKLEHPGIVEYVAHGAEADGSLWFAVGLPEGETLQARLARARLTVDECRELGLGVARALGAAHAVGVVHRDLKPQNIFLAGKSIAAPKLFDFGIASVVGSTTLTNAAELLGTPAYMAPELAKGTNVTAAADVFSIGCVLFEGLTGRPPFGSGPPLAVMAKLLLEDAPPILTVREDIPRGFAELVDRMLAKHATARFADGAALAEALSGLAPSPMPPQVSSSTESIPPKKAEPARPLGASPAKLAMRERQLLSVLLVGKPPSGEAIPLPSDGPTITTPMGSSPLDVVYGEVLQRGGWAERLVDGTIVISLPGEAATVDQAASAARCAWAVRRVMPGVPIALATGRTDGSEGFPVGEVIERGVSLLDAAASAGELTGTGVFVDELTAGLLDRRFMIRADKGNFWLVGEGEPRGAGRSILGQTSPFVGRKLELDQLVQRYIEAVSTKSCRITLVTGPPGMGKSRLRHELMTTLEGKHPTPTVLLGRGDPSRSSAALSLVAAAFSDLFGLREGEGEEVARHRVRARVSRNVPRQDRDRVTAFLGELVGVKFAESTHPPLAEARADRTRMADQTRTACQDFFAAEISRGPLVLVLDDLHAADAPSVMFLDFVLRVFGESPLFVVGLARSEIVDRFPTVWGGKPVEMLPLAPLSPQAAQLLAEQILGDTDARIPLVVERAQGNAFFLEELLRSIVEGRGDSLPETLYAAIDAQLGALPPFARRVLRCASVFGERFTLIGVRAILLEGSDSDVRSVFATLVDRELVRPTGSNTDGGGPTEFVFASEIVRGACYEELTEVDRKAAHRLCGEWLESIAKPEDASELARHYTAAGDTRRAAMWLVRAAQIALEVGDFGQAAEATERAAKSGAVGLLLARARLLQSEAARYTGDSRAMFEHASEAMQLLPPRTPAWWTAAADSLAGAVQLAQSARIEELAKEMVDGANIPPVEAARAAVHLLHVGKRAEADTILERVAAAGTLRGWGHRAIAFRAMYRGDIGEHLAQREQSVRAFAGAGDVREAAAELVSLGFIRHELGLYTEAEESLRESLAIAERLDLRAVSADARERLGNVLMRLGLTSEAETFLKSSLERVTQQGNRRLEGRCRRQLGLLYLDRRALGPAMEEIMHASQLLSVFPPLLPTALAACARVLLAHGARDEALFMAGDALEALKRVKTVDEGEAFTLLTHAETLHAVNKTAEATDAIKAARTRLLARAGTLDPKRAKTFLEEVSENCRTIELAKDWLNERPPPPPPEAPKAPPKPEAAKPEPKPERFVIRQDTPFASDKPAQPKPKLVLRAVSPAAPPSRPAGFLVSGSPERIELMAAALKELRADVYRAKTSAEMFRQLDGMTTTPTKLVVFVDPLADGVDSSTFAGLVRAHERGRNCQLVIASAGVAAKLRSTARSWGADGFVPLTGKGPEVAEAMRPFFDVSK